MEMTKEQAAELSRMSIEAGQRVRRAERERDEAQHAAQMQKIFAEAARETGQAQLEKRVSAEQLLKKEQEENERLRGVIGKLEAEVRKDRRPLRILKKMYAYWLDETTEAFRVWTLFLLGVLFTVCLGFIAWAIASMTWTPPVI